MPTKSEISLIRSLSDKRSREENGLFVVEGHKMVAEALASQWRVRKLFFCGTKANLCGKDGVVSEEISMRDMERMSSLRTPQGALAVVEIPSQAPLCHDNGLILALDGIQDPGNLGTIIRTADWFGIGRIVCSPDCADRFNPKAVQASMGAIFRMPVSYGELVFPPETPVYGAFLDGDNIYDARLSPCGVIMLGSEGRGISAAAAKCVTHRITIPSCSPRAESLNVAAAAAIICSEFTRRLRALRDIG